MVRGILFLAVSASFGVSRASQPGQPLDCSDMTFSVAGLSCSPVATFPQPDSRFIGRGSNMAIDNEGYVYVGVQRSGVPGPNGIEIHRSRDGGQTVEVVATILSRDAPQGGWDGIRFTNYRDSVFAGDEERILFDASSGRLLVWLTTLCDVTGQPYEGGRWIAAIEGLATTFEVLQTYVPQPAQVGFRVPYMPEGFRSADRFDTFYGNVSDLPDFTVAHPMACNVPGDHAPQMGEYITIPDTSPLPTAGAASYIVTAVTHGGQKRYGRKRIAGVLSGRDPALLPACPVANVAATP